MTITLTREEAQQVEQYIKPGALVPVDMQTTQLLVNALRARLSQPEPEPVAWLHSFTGYGWQVVPEKLYPTDQPLYTAPPQAEPKPVTDKYLMEVECTKCGAKQDGVLTVTVPPQPEPVPVRLRRGDILRCIETNELCTVWATSTTGKTQVKWKANDFGSYTAEQIGDLFWVEPKPEPEPVAWMNEGDIGKTDWKVWAHGKPTATIPLYATECMPDDLIATYEKGFADGKAKSEWQGLTEHEKALVMRRSVNRQDAVTLTETMLREKNT